MARFNRWDVCEAYYCYAMEYHQGQFSKAYKVFGRLQKLGFEPSYMIREYGSEQLGHNARDIFDLLVDKDY